MNSLSSIVQLVKNCFSQLHPWNNTTMPNIHSLLRFLINAKHPYTDDDLYVCDYCDREFRSEESLENHTNAKHPFEPEVFEGVPFEGAEGEWVYRKEFKGRKGFGLFVCTSCSRHWMSAHARRDLYGQGCQSCEKKIFAYIMWQSYGHRDNDQEESDSTPHDASRCDACKAGNYCTAKSHSHLFKGDW
jgi:hypothetical protein